MHDRLEEVFSPKPTTKTNSISIKLYQLKIMMKDNTNPKIIKQQQ